MIDVGEQPQKRNDPQSKEVTYISIWLIEREIMRNLKAVNIVLRLFYHYIM